MSAIVNGHVQVLLLGTTGQVPTVPQVPTAKPGDIGWVDATDILIGEFAINKVDNKVWFRSSTGLILMPSTVDITNLSNAISDESNARSTADGTLLTAINNEATNRQNGDNAVVNYVDSKIPVYPLSGFSGANFGAKLQTAINFVPSGSVIDCSLTTGISLQILASVNVTKPCEIRLGANHVTADVGAGNDAISIQSPGVKILGVSCSSKNTDLNGQTSIQMLSGRWHVAATGDNNVVVDGFDCLGVPSTPYKYVAGTTTLKDGITNPYSFNNDGSGGLYFAEGDPFIGGGGNSVSKITITNMFIYNTRNTGILILGAVTCRIENTRVSGASAHGIYIGSSSTTVSLINNYVSSAMLGGIVIDGAATSVLISNATEASGIGLWLKSCTSIEMIGHYSEANGTRDTGRIPNNTGIFVNNSVGGQFIPDIGSDNLTLFRGHSYVVTGGRNIYMPNAYSNNPGTNVEGTSSQTRHILIRGSVREIYILNPRCTRTTPAVATPTTQRFDIGIETLSPDSPRDVNLFFNPSLDGSVIPAIAGKYITNINTTAEGTVILDQGTNTRIQSGADIWTYSSLRRTTVADADYTSGINDNLIALTSISTPRTTTLKTPPSGSLVRYMAKDENKLLSSVNTWTFVGEGGKTVEGVASFVVSEKGWAGEFYYNGTNWCLFSSTNDDTVKTHVNNVSNPHGVTKSQVGLSNVDNTSDVNKPVSTAQATANATTLANANAYADSLVVGLLDDRGNYNPATNSNLYPTTGGSGAAGAIKKGDLFSINGLGTGVSASIGGKTVTDGDVIRALSDTPAQVDASWNITENNFGYVAENAANKSSNVATDSASTTKYATVKAIFDWATALFQTLANKDASGGYAGLTLFKINFKNSLNTFTSFFTNANTAARTYTFQDRDGTIADNTDLALKLSIAGLAAQMAGYNVLEKGYFSWIATQVAETYIMLSASSAIVTSKSGTSFANNPAIIYINPAKYPSVNGLTPKMSISANVFVNNTAPASDVSFALYALTQPPSSGGAGVRSYTIAAAAVTGSATATISAPAANTSSHVDSADFDVPPAGYYAICLKSTGTTPTNFYAHCSADLQLRYI